MDKNTQQPVAWLSIDCIGERYLCFSEPSDNDEKLALYTAPPVPRDVLMAALNEVNTKYMEVCGAQFGDEYIAAIADRYASQVQPDRNTVTLKEMVVELKTGENGDAISEAMAQATADMALGRAIREGRADWRRHLPEPVNQQTLAALKLGKNSLVAFKLMPGQSNAWEEHDEANLVAINAAIAAAEAAQPDHIVDADKMVHAVPDVLEQLQLAETEVTNAKTWSAGEQAKTHCKYALTAIAVARSLLSATQKPDGV